MLSFALHAYHNVVITSTRLTMYSPMYGIETMIALVVEILLLRVLIDSELEEAKWAKVRNK